MPAKISMVGWISVEPSLGEISVMNTAAARLNGAAISSARPQVTSEPKMKMAAPTAPPPWEPLSDGLHSAENRNSPTLCPNTVKVPTPL